MTTTPRPPLPLEARHYRLLRLLADGHTVERTKSMYFQVALKDKSGRIVDYINSATVGMLERRNLVVMDYVNGKRRWKITEAGQELLREKA